MMVGLLISRVWPTVGSVYLSACVFWFLLSGISVCCVSDGFIC